MIIDGKFQGLNLVNMDQKKEKKIEVNPELIKYARIEIINVNKPE